MAGEQEAAVIPLVEERLVVGKRQVEADRVRVRVGVTEREERVPVELLHDEVEIERVPRGVTLTELPSVRLEGTTTVIPVVEEQVIVEKRLVLVEEIHVRRRTTSAAEEIQVRLCSEQAIVERDEGERQAIERTPVL